MPNRPPVLLLAATLLACGGGETPPRQAPPRAEPAGTGGEASSAAPTGRLPADVVPTRYALTLAIDPSREAFTGVAEIDVRLPARQSAIYLHAQGLDVSEVSVAEGGGDPSPASWAMADEERHVASITPQRPVGPGVVRLRVTYGAAYDRTLEGLYRVDQGEDHYAFTQMEPLGARKAFPCFDEPSFKTPFDVTLVVPEGQTAIANGPQQAAQPTTGGMQRVRFATTQPLPTYLVAFAVGPFDVVEGDPIAANDVRSSALPFRAIAPRGQGARLAHAIEHTPGLLLALERYFGIPYPYAKLDLIAVPDFSAGAMENAGAITFRDHLLLVGEDAPVSQQRGFAYVTAHELAHQWFGNLVTMQWWDDLWLNEAFANWMEAQTIAATFPQFEPDVAEMGVALDAMGADSLASARQIRQPIETEHDVHNAFDSITYNKGNAVLAMFEQWLTPEVFRRGVSRYLREHAHGNASAADLLAALSAEAERDVRAPFESFLNQPGVPLVEVTPTCEGEPRLVVRQSRYLPLGSAASAAQSWQLPFCARYSAGGEERRACALLGEVEATVPLEGCPDWVMPNAGGVGYYRWTLPAEALSALRSRGLGALSVREAMSLADSTDASFAAGRTSYADALGALSPLASRDERALATAPMELLSFAIDHVLATDAERDAARRRGAALYAPRARRLGWTVGRAEDPETQLLRASVLGFMASVARDARTRHEAARRGRAYLGVGRDRLEPSAVAPDLASLAVATAIEEGGAEVFDVALERLGASQDPVERRNLLAGLSASRDEALATRALELVLTDTVRVNEIFRPLMTQLRTRETRPRAFGWLTEHYDALLGRMGPGLGGYLPYAGSSFCTAERAAELRAFFEPRVGATQGGPRNLALAVEGVELCAARAEHARQSSADAF